MWYNLDFPCGEKYGSIVCRSPPFIPPACHRALCHLNSPVWIGSNVFFFYFIISSWGMPTIPLSHPSGSNIFIFILILIYHFFVGVTFMGKGGIFWALFRARPFISEKCMVIHWTSGHVNKVWFGLTMLPYLLFLRCNIWRFAPQTKTSLWHKSNVNLLAILHSDAGSSNGSYQKTLKSHCSFCSNFVLPCNKTIELESIFKSNFKYHTLYL